MGNGIKVFEQSGLGSVRVVMQGNEPWFVAKDVIRALGYADYYNPSRATQAIPDEWKGVQRMHTPGGDQEMLTISEQGLYFFLGRSDKPAALPYQALSDPGTTQQDINSPILCSRRTSRQVLPGHLWFRRWTPEHGTKGAA